MQFRGEINLPGHVADVLTLYLSALRDESHDQRLARIESETSEDGDFRATQAEQMQHLNYLQGYILSEAAEFKNLPAGTAWKIRIDEAPFAREIALIDKIQKNIRFSDAYLEAREKGVARFIEALRNDTDMQYAARMWDDMPEHGRAAYLRRAMDLQKRHMAFDGFKNNMRLSLVFNDIQPATNPITGTTSCILGVARFLGPRIRLDWAFGFQRPGTHIEYNTHPDSGFLTRSFADAVGIMAHEGTHAMQNALAQASRNNSIGEKHKLAADAKIFADTHAYNAYTPSQIYSVYRTQPMEADAIYVQKEVEKALAAPSMQADWVCDPQALARFRNRNALCALLTSAIYSAPLPRI